MACAYEQFETAVERHRRSGRELMRGRDEDQPRRILAQADGHALFVERHGGDDGAGGLEGDVGAAIARAFDPGEIAGASNAAATSAMPDWADGMIRIWRGLALIPR